VVDEAYVEFTEEESARTVLDDYPNLLLMRTFSKAFGLAGLRLGYLMGHPAVMQELLKARLPFMIDRLAEMTAMALLERPELLRERIALLKQECRSITTALAAMDGVDVVPSQSNFVLFKTPLETKLLLNRLATSGVLVRDMSGYPELQGYLRVNAGTPDENKAFLVALKKTLET
jgi:histidinol-phosphate aminotransferase